MAKLLTKSGFAAPSADVMAAIDGEAKAAALRQACFEYDAKRRDLELNFETALSQLRELYLAEVLNKSGTAYTSRPSRQAPPSTLPAKFRRGKMTGRRRLAARCR